MQASVSPRRPTPAVAGQCRCACLAIGVLVLTRADFAYAEPAHADDPVHADPVRAEESTTTGNERSAALFYEGRSLLNKGRFAEACEKFQASLALKRAAGTLLNVANCQQAAGDWVAALESVEGALSLAGREPDKRKREGWTAAASDEIASLELRVARVTVHSSAESPPAVTVDGVPLVEFDTPLRLNPGRHRLEAAAPRRKPFAMDLELSPGQAETVEIPELELDTPEPRATEPPPPVALAEPLPAAGMSPDAPEPSAVLPWSLVAVGSAVFAGGAVTGLVAAKLTSDLKRDCPDRRCAGDLSQRDDARTTALVADALMGAGLVAGSIGVALLLTDAAPSAAPVAVACGPGSCATYIRGAF
jgi:tetratricopeptide (TPR) repeat protein